MSDEKMEEQHETELTKFMREFPVIGVHRYTREGGRVDEGYGAYRSEQEALDAGAMRTMRDAKEYSAMILGGMTRMGTWPLDGSGAAYIRASDFGLQQGTSGRLVIELPEKQLGPIEVRGSPEMRRRFARAAVGGRITSVEFISDEEMESIDRLEQFAMLEGKPR